MNKNALETESLISLLNTDNTLSVNRLLAHSIGLEQTIMYQALIKKFVYYKDRGMLVEEKWFYSTSIDLEESTTFSEKKQKRISDKLCELKLIEKKKMGMPSKNYYSINFNKQIILDYIESGDRKCKELIEKRVIKMTEHNSFYREKASNNHRTANIEVQEQTNERFKNGQMGGSRTDKQAVQEQTNRQFKNRQTGSSRTDNTAVLEQTERRDLNSQNVGIRTDKMAGKTKDNKLKKETKVINRSFNQTKETESRERMNERKNKILSEEYVAYDYFVENEPDKIELVNKIRDIVYRVLSCENQTVQFGKQSYPTEEFKKRIKKMDEELVNSIIEKIGTSQEQIHNPEAYLAKMIYEEPFQYDFQLASYNIN